MTPRPSISDDHVREALRAFARSHLIAGGSLRHKAYQSWSAAPVSSTTLTKRLTNDNSWTTLVLDNAAAMAAQAVDASAVVAELPVRCTGSLGVTWMSAPVSEWLSLRCACSYCSEPTLREAFPQLVGRLANPRDADKSSSLWLEWLCPVNHPDHRRMQGTATTIAAGDRYCGGCRSLDRYYSDHPPGTTMRNREVARAKIEQPVIDELRKQLPEMTFSYQLSVVVPRVFELRTGRAITPDFLLLDQRVVVEIDGSGVGGYASRHDSLEGVANDTARDQAMAALGFRTIRVRHPRSPALSESPAHVIVTTSTSPRVLAGLIAAELRPTTPPDHTA